MSCIAETFRRIPLCVPSYRRARKPTLDCFYFGEIWSKSFLVKLSLEQVADPTGFIKKAVEQASLCFRSTESLSLL